MRAFGSDPPKTMSKEWQEASNEYLKVRRTPLFIPPRNGSKLTYNRNNVPSLLPVSRPKTTAAQAWFSRRPSTRRTRPSLFNTYQTKPTLVSKSLSVCPHRTAVQGINLHVQNKKQLEWDGVVGGGGALAIQSKSSLTIASSSNNSSSTSEIPIFISSWDPVSVPRRSRLVDWIMPSVVNMYQRKQTFFAVL